MSNSTSTKMPTMIGKFQVKSVLGRGGMGIVYLAVDPHLHRQVAIKTLTEDFSGKVEMLKRFYVEAGRTAALFHPHIVVVHEAGDQDGKPYLVMEYIEGESLDSIIKSAGHIPLEAKLSIVAQVCDALAYAHRKGVIHRDVKPANVIVKDGIFAKLVDFGIARAEQERLDQSLTLTGSLIGTPAYMAPERIQGMPIDGRSDIFSVGVLLYQLITNHLPFDAEFPTIIQQILKDEPALPSEVVTECPKGVDVIISRALAKRPSQRYGSADEMASDLSAIVEAVTSDRIRTVMSKAQQSFDQNSYLAARELILQLLRIDAKHIEAKRLLARIEQQLARQEDERKARELGRLAQQAANSKEWPRALDLCDQALAVLPESKTLLDLRLAIVGKKKTQEEVSLLMARTVSAQDIGDLEGAKVYAENARRLDPFNSQVITVCEALEHEIEEKRRHEELRQHLDRAERALESGDIEEAQASLTQAEATSPGDPVIFPLRDMVTSLLADQRRHQLIQRIEQQLPVASTVDKLNSILAEVETALHEYPVEPSLIRMKLEIEPRIRKFETEAHVRATIKRAEGLPVEEALICVREGLLKAPGNKRLRDLENVYSGRLAEYSRRMQVSQQLRQARQALDDHLYLEAVKILQRCKADGYSSSEIDLLLSAAQSAASEHMYQERIERTYSEARRLLEEQNYSSAIHILHNALEEIDEPILRRQLDEATAKQAALERHTSDLVATVQSLVNVGLIPEAVRLLDGQQPGVQRLPTFKAERARADTLLARETSFWSALGKAYSAIGCIERIADLRVALSSEYDNLGSPSVLALQRQLRTRMLVFAHEKVSLALQHAEADLADDDADAAYADITTAKLWVEFAEPADQEEFRAVESRVASARKLLNIKKYLSR